MDFILKYYHATEMVLGFLEWPTYTAHFSGISLPNRTGSQTSAPEREWKGSRIIVIAMMYILHLKFPFKKEKKKSLMKEDQGSTKFVTDRGPNISSSASAQNRLGSKTHTPKRIIFRATG